MPLKQTSFRYFRTLHRHAQAYLQVRLIGPRGKSVLIVTLLDTGAAYSALDQAFAYQCGYAIASLPVVSIKLADGNLARMRAIPNAQLDIEGQAVTTKQILLLSSTATPILATRDLLLRTDFGVDSSALYFD